MWERVGVERDEAGLAAAAAELEALAAQQAAAAGAAAVGVAAAPATVREDATAALAGAVAGSQGLTACQSAHRPGEARNLLWAARLLTQAALARRESRGGHYRTDYPCPDVAWQHRLFLTATPGGAARFESVEPAAAVETNLRVVEPAEEVEAAAAAAAAAAW